MRWDRLRALSPWLAAVVSAVGGGYLVEHGKTVAEMIASFLQ
jgi:hypothetical protein